MGQRPAQLTRKSDLRPVRVGPCPTNAEMTLPVPSPSGRAVRKNRIQCLLTCHNPVGPCPEVSSPRVVPPCSWKSFVDSHASAKRPVTADSPAPQLTTLTRRLASKFCISTFVAKQDVPCSKASLKTQMFVGCTGLRRAELLAVSLRPKHCFERVDWSLFLLAFMSIFHAHMTLF